MHTKGKINALLAGILAMIALYLINLRIMGKANIALLGEETLFTERQALSLLMATFTNPSVLLLDEHTAALDPARAQLITELTKKVVEKPNLTTLMVTHNMKQAIELGNRLIMMDKGRIILDVLEEEKKQLTIERLLKEFERFKGVASDRVILGA